MDGDYPINTRVYWPTARPTCHGHVVGSDGPVYRLITDCRRHVHSSQAPGPESDGLCVWPKDDVGLDRRAR